MDGACGHGSFVVTEERTSRWRPVDPRWPLSRVGEAVERGVGEGESGEAASADPGALFMPSARSMIPGDDIMKTRGAR